MKTSKGVTLIELCLICALLGIILTLSWPQLAAAARETQFKSDVSRIAQVFQQVRDAALQEGAHYRLSIDIYTHMLYIEKELSPGEFGSVNDSRLNSIHLSERITISDISKSSILFYPDGSCDSVVLTLAGEHDISAMLSINGTNFKTIIKN